MPRYCSDGLKLSTADLARQEDQWLMLVLLRFIPLERRGREGQRRGTQSGFSVFLRENLCALCVKDLVPAAGERHAALKNYGRAELGGTPQLPFIRGIRASSSRRNSEICA